MFRIISFTCNFFDKQKILAAEPIAWFSGLGVFLADAAARGKPTIYMVVVACVIDLICGIAVSVKRGRFTRSDLMRLTVEKLLIYGCVLVLFLCLDKYLIEETSLDWKLTSTLVGVIITMTEAWSSLASLLILFPKHPLLRILQKALTAELAGKLGCEKDEVEAILNEARRSKQKRGKNGRFVASKKKTCGVVETFNKKKKKK